MMKNAECLISRQHLEIENLTQKDDRLIPESADEIRLFMVVRNEALRLPYTINYYRKMGVNRFFIIDNNSTDTTREFLLAQPDTHVFFTGQSFTGFWKWIEALLERYGKNHWCLVVDADEIFVYPHYEAISLFDLCKYLDKMKHDAIHSILVDMYPDKEVALNRYQAGDDLFQNSPYFDPYCYARDYWEWRNPKTGRDFCFNAYHDGTRFRIFGLHVCCSKVPLLKYSDKVYLTEGMHTIDGANLSELQGAVLHFKFLPDFASRVNEEAEREQHWNNAYEYKVYAKKINEGNFKRLYHQGSLKYEGSNQLVKLGFMKSSMDYENYLAELLSGTKNTTGRLD
jgi:glycosyltransferase involved in cell wall biosynthesis